MSRLTAVILCLGVVTFLAWAFTRSAPPFPSAPPAVEHATTPVATPAEHALLAHFATPAFASGPRSREITTALRMLQLSPKSSDAWLRLAEAVAERSRVTLDPDLYEPVEQTYLQAYKLDATNTAALVGLAWAAAAAHRFDDSVAWATLALRDDPEQPEAHGLLGDAAVELGRYTEAESHYEKMQNLRPGVAAFSRSAHLLYLQGEVAPAIDLLNLALDSAGGAPGPSAWCVAELATIHCRENASAAAMALLEIWQKKIPDDLLLLNAVGHTRMTLGQDDLAIAAYERALALRPQHTTLAALHDIYVATNRASEAAALVNRIEKLANRLRAQGVQGGEGALARFYADHRIRLSEAVSLAETEYTHHRGALAAATLAWAYHQAGRTAAAANLLPVFLRDRAPEPGLLYYAAVIEEAAGDFASARRHYAAALSRQPRWHPLHSPLAQAALARLPLAPSPVAP
jgi:tetratricopeptide (TPR) repeat protein